MGWGISIRLFSIRYGPIAALGLLVSAATPALAQSGPEPAAIERTIPRPGPEAAISPSIPVPLREIPVQSIGTGRFTLGAVNIDGATVFTRAELSREFEPFLASEVDGPKLAEIAARITGRYRHGGYLLSYATIPSQNVQAGMVRLAIVEGRIGSVTVAGAGPEQAAIEAIAAPLLKDSPLRAATLERALGLMRDYPGLSVIDVALMRSDGPAGLYALKIKVARNRMRAYSYMDNRGTGSIGRTRLFSSASFSSLAAQGDELRVDLFAMPGHRFRYLYGQVQASVPIGRNGLRLTMAASKGDQYLLSDERFDGDSTNLTAQLSFPVLRSRALTLVAKASVNDWRSFGEADHSRELRDRLRVARLGFELSNEARTRIQGEFSLSRGLDFGGMTSVGDPLASREDAGGSFAKAAFTLQVNRPLSDKVGLQAVVAGQYSDRPLLSAEEFALGGNRIGRAFAFNALTGDRGIGGGVEVSYRLKDSKRDPAGVQLFGFVDGGAVYEAKSELVTDRSRSLVSAGVGTRFTVAGAVLSVEAGVPIFARGQDKSVRLFFSTYRAF
jgi:hemolysin activation/secretion protein